MNTHSNILSFLTGTSGARFLAPLTLGAAVCVLSGCGNYAPDDATFLRAVPRVIDIALQPPGAELENQSPAVPGQMMQALSASECTDAPLRCQAQQTATDFNNLTTGLVTIIDDILESPPSMRLQTRRVWGPVWLGDQEGDLTIRFELERFDDPESVNLFRFCLHAVRGNRAGFGAGNEMTCDTEVDAETNLTRVLWGGLTPGQDEDAEAASGAGRLILDGNTLATISDDPDSELLATIDITYDNFGGSQLVDLTIRDLPLVDGQNENPFTEAAYRFARLPDGSGDFGFAVRADINGTSFLGPTVLETYEIQAQWGANKAGSARAAVYGGDLGQNPDGSEVRWDVVECWDETLHTVFYLDPEPDNLDVGDIMDCLVPIPAAQ